MEIGIVWLLRAAWIAGILPILLALLPFSRLSWYRRTILEFAKRGKILQSSSKVSGRIVNCQCTRLFMFPQPLWLECMCLGLS